MAQNLETALFCLVITGLFSLFLLSYSQSVNVRCELQNKTALYTIPPANMTQYQWELWSRDVIQQCSQAIPVWVWVLALTPAFFGLGIYILHPFK